MQQKCEFLALQHLLGNKYTIPLLFEIKKEPLRFNQIRKITNKKINNNLLIKTLKNLKKVNIISKINKNGIFYYQITKKGEEVIDILFKLKEQTNKDLENCSFNCFKCNSF